MSKKIHLFWIIPFVLLSISCNRVQRDKSFKETQEETSLLAEQVKTEFRHAWGSYMKYAKGYDALKPLSGTGHNWYSRSFVMTPLDAFDTMILMGLTEEAREAKALILDSLDFDRDIVVQNFEITIRMLGGLISAYQLDGDTAFLNLAVDLADRLLPVFDSPTGMPYWGVNLKTGQTRGNISNPAETGTLMLEFGSLTKLTGNPVYYDKAKRAVMELYARQSDIGLVGEEINVETGEWTNSICHLGGRIDSYYEYLLKSWLLFDDPDFYSMWETSILAIDKYLADSTDSGLWYGQADMNTGERVSSRFGALDAFFPAVLALDNKIDRAVALQENCFKMWEKWSIEPEQIDYVKMEVVYPAYLLRPENIESAFYLYHFTHDKVYLEMGKVYLNSLTKHCKTEKGYAMLKSVITKEKGDEMESFFLAETLKYLYLLFAPSETIDWEAMIFNTEAHPIRKTWK